MCWYFLYPFFQGYVQLSDNFSGPITFDEAKKHFSLIHRVLQHGTEINSSLQSIGLDTPEF